MPLTDIRSMMGAPMSERIAGYQKVQETGARLGAMRGAGGGSLQAYFEGKIVREKQNQAGKIIDGLLEAGGAELLEQMWPQLVKTSPDIFGKMNLEAIVAPIKQKQEQEAKAKKAEFGLKERGVAAREVSAEAAATVAETGVAREERLGEPKEEKPLSEKDRLLRGLWDKLSIDEQKKAVGAYIEERKGKKLSQKEKYLKELWNTLSEDEKKKAVSAYVPKEGKAEADKFRWHEGARRAITNVLGQLTVTGGIVVDKDKKEIQKIALSKLERLRAKGLDQNAASIQAIAEAAEVVNRKKTKGKTKDESFIDRMKRKIMGVFGEEALPQAPEAPATPTDAESFTSKYGIE